MAIAIIFSKDRACQLHLLLESMWEHTDPDLFSYIYVIYKSSNRDYELGYREIKECYDYVTFIPEMDFKTDILTILNKNKEEEQVCFFTDDDIIYQDIDLTQESLNTIFEVGVVGLFSLRLGRNIVMQDLPTNMTTYIPEFKNVSVSGIEEYLLCWNWNNCPHHLDYGYPLSVDGHIFRISDITPIIESIGCENPNFMEGNMCHKLSMLPQLGISYQHSKVVNLPINRVQTVFTNRFGNTFPRTQEELNKEYLTGKTIDLDKIDFSHIYCSHQELPMEFK
jgi:hypothetical protein